MSLASVLVTGANRGIGLEFIKQLVALAPSPKHVFATCRDPSGAEELNKIAAKHNNVHVLKLEVRDYASHPSLAKQVSDVVGGDGLEVLINNAGIYRKFELEEGDPKDMMENYEVNVVAPLMLIRAFLPLLKQSAAKRRTLIINISSKIGSIDDNSSGHIYSYRASKTALNMVTKSLSVELVKDNILCYAVHPGAVQTDMNQRNFLINTETSVVNMLETIKNPNPEHNGKMLNYDGKVIPW